MHPMPLASMLAGPMDYAESVLDLIGDTPLVRLRRVVADLGPEDAQPLLLAKLEMFNPGGSVKDRIGLRMIEAAERSGALRPGGTIVEPTSGNTGVGLAIAANLRGYRCIFVMADKQSEEKRALLRAYGAEVVVCPTDVPPESPQSYYRTAERLVRETPGAWMPGQYWNQENPRAHELTTGPEIRRQTAGRVTHLVASAGTGGTMTGTARYLRSQRADLVVVGGDTEGSVFSGDTPHPYLTEGVGEDFFPDTIDTSLVNRWVRVPDREAFAAARSLARLEGILAGESSGTALVAAREVVRSLVAGGEARGKIVVVILPDTGRNYLSKLFNDDWLRDHGLSDDESPESRPQAEAAGRAASHHGTGAAKPKAEPRVLGSLSKGSTRPGPKSGAQARAKRQTAPPMPEAGSPGPAPHAKPEVRA